MGFFEQGVFEGKAEETTTATKYERLAKLVNFTRLRVPIVGDKTHQAPAVYHLNPSMMNLTGCHILKQAGSDSTAELLKPGEVATRNHEIMQTLEKAHDS